MRNHREILRLYRLKFCYGEIADSCNCSKSTVSRTIERFKKLKLSWETIDNMTDAELSNVLFPRADKQIKYHMPDFQMIEHELSRPGVTLQLLWLEYCEKCIAGNFQAYKYTQFRKYYYDYVHKNRATMHIEHKIGDIMEVDWAGTKLSIINRITGKSEKVSVFVAVLPYSGYTYVEAFLTEKENSWVEAHIHAYDYFGGVTRILVSDNLKTGVIKNTKTETILNQTYYELGNHYGVAILPARPRSPQDKATVEGAVKNITTSIIARLRNNQYFSLNELNIDILELLKKYNDTPFQKKEHSRSILFEEERKYLQPLPVNKFEIVEWKHATVQYNYHVSIQGKNYSCPYEYIHKVVNVKISANTVDIFYEGKCIASHQKLSEKGANYSTIFEHMPEDHQKYSKWDKDHFRRWAKKYGDSTLSVIDYFLTSGRVEEQGYKSCMALLSMGNDYSREMIENVCTICISRTHSPSLKLIKSILATELKDDKNKISQSSHGISRGPEYYSQEMDKI